MHVCAHFSIPVRVLEKRRISYLQQQSIDPAHSYRQTLKYTRMAGWLLELD